MKKPNRYLKGGFRIRPDGTPVASMASRLTRRQFIGGVAAGVGATAMVGAGTVRAIGDDPWDNEILYLSHCYTNDYAATVEPRNGTDIFQVYLNSGTGQAELTHIFNTKERYNANAANPSPYGNKYDVVAAIAVSDDGEIMYMADFASKAFGIYEFATDTLTHLGYVNIPNRAALMALSSSQELYLSRTGNGLIYHISKTNGTTIHTWTIKTWVDPGPVLKTIDIEGADMAFGFELEGDVYVEKLYVWANGDDLGAPRGLYAINASDLVHSTSQLIAEFRGTSVHQFFTGMAARASGYGDLVVSETFLERPRYSQNRDINGWPFAPGEVVVLHKQPNGGPLFGDSYTMYLNGEPFEHQWGDMTTGRLGVICTRTIGYWKTHSWNGATVTICGEPVNETLGKEILWAARGNYFSMLFAQLIAAKLNVNNATGIPEIDEAEAWLCSLPPEIEWNTPFKGQYWSYKSAATALWSALDNFNNEFECDENNEIPR